MFKQERSSVFSSASFNFLNKLLVPEWQNLIFSPLYQILHYMLCSGKLNQYLLSAVPVQLLVFNIFLLRSSWDIQKLYLNCFYENTINCAYLTESRSRIYVSAYLTLVASLVAFRKPLVYFESGFRKPFCKVKDGFH